MTIENQTSKLFGTVNETAAQTGLSRYFVRNCVKSGLAPCVWSGSRPLINIPAFVAKLNEMSK